MNTDRCVYVAAEMDVRALIDKCIFFNQTIFILKAESLKIPYKLRKFKAQRNERGEAK